MEVIPKYPPSANGLRSHSLGHIGYVLRSSWFHKGGQEIAVRDGLVPILRPVHWDTYLVVLDACAVTYVEVVYGCHWHGSGGSTGVKVPTHVSGCQGALPM